MSRAETGRRLLLVEDDAATRKLLRWLLEGIDILEAENRNTALAQLRAHDPQLVLLDLGLPPDREGVSEGMALLETIQAESPATKVIVLTGQDEHGHALRAIAAGALDFHAKPPSETLRSLIERSFYIHELEQENRRLQRHALPERLPGLIGDSPAMLKLYRGIERIAPARVSVVLLGESGSGKEVVARALHALSDRHQKRFVAINCAAIPPALLEAELFGYERGAFTGAFKQTQGRIELADRGTLFLDEIGDLPLELQAKLLRFLQERVIERVGGRHEIAVDVRVVCATHRDLGQRVKEQAFREDLYYRLAEVSLTIPPLRERTGDAVLLARHFLGVYGEELGRRGLSLSDEALAAIDSYEWPGNIRELQNRLKRAIIMAEGRRLTPADLDLEPGSWTTAELNLRRARERAELDVLRRALAQAQGNVSKAARLMGVSRPTLYDLLHQHDLRA